MDPTGELKNLLLPSKKYVGREGKNLALIKIQAFLRMKAK